MTYVVFTEQLFVSPIEKEREGGGAAVQGKQKVGKVYEDEDEDYFNAPEVSTRAIGQLSSMVDICPFVSFLYSRYLS